MNYPKLAIIDDDDIYRFAVQRILKRSGVAENIRSFTNGADALAYFQEAEAETLPDVLLLDLNMPVMDGWDFLERFRQLRPVLPKQITIFIVSSSINPQDHERAKAISEVEDFLVKPILPRELKERLQQLQG